MELFQLLFSKPITKGVIMAKALQVTNNISTTGQYVQDQDGNATVLAIETSNVGIGTTNPSAKLHISGTTNVVRLDYVGILDNPNLWISQNAYYNGSWNRITDGHKCAAISIDDAARNVDINTCTTTTGTPSFSTKVRFQNDGCVGIGTTSPVQKLEVNGAIVLGNKIAGTPNDGTLWFDGTYLNFQVGGLLKVVSLL